MSATHSTHYLNSSEDRKTLGLPCLQTFTVVKTVPFWFWKSSFKSTTVSDKTCFQEKWVVHKGVYRNLLPYIYVCVYTKLQTHFLVWDYEGMYPGSCTCETWEKPGILLVLACMNARPVLVFDLVWLFNTCIFISYQ